MVVAVVVAALPVVVAVVAADQACGLSHKKRPIWAVFCGHRQGRWPEARIQVPRSWWLTPGTNHGQDHNGDQHQGWDFVEDPIPDMTALIAIFGKVFHNPGANMMVAK